MLTSSLAVLNCDRVLLPNSMPNVSTKFKMALNQKAAMAFFFFSPEEAKFSTGTFTLKFPFHQLVSLLWKDIKVRM